MTVPINTGKLASKAVSLIVSIRKSPAVQLEKR